ncbi:MAG: hypothetical protein H7124_10825 [Phycisphaerales bacterium]|nr:hypothetical protein [Hyphomonadaceae bacterium]
MTDAAQPAPTANRGFIWWLSVILAPIGLFGGPIEIANMVSGVVEWRGPIGYLVNFWSENVSVHFANVFGLITNFFNIRPLSDIVVSYLTLGVLFISSTLRAIALMQIKLPPLMLWLVLPTAIFAWPAVFLQLDGLLHKKSRGPTLLILAPFLLFLVLFAINAVWANA